MATETSEIVVSLVDQASDPARQMSQAFSNLSKQLSGTFEQINTWVEEARKRYDSATAGAYALADALKAPVTAAMDFETAMIGVTGAVDFPTPEGLEAFKRSLIEMSGRVSTTATDLAAMAAAASQAGIASSDLLQFTEIAAKIGTAFGMSAKDTASALAEMKTSLGLSIDEVTALADAIGFLGQTQSSTAAGIMTFTQSVADGARGFGFAAEEAAAFGSAMIAAGAAPAAAATAFQTMGKALTTGASATQSQQEAFNALGLTAQDVAGRMQADAAGTTQDVLARLAQLPEGMRAAVASDLFGDNAKTLGPLVDNLDLLKEGLGLVADENQYAGSATAEYERKADTTAAALQRLQNRMTGLSIAVGSALLPPLKLAIDTIGPFIQMITDLAAAYPWVTRVMVVGTAALVGLRVAALGAQFSLGFLKDAVQMVGKPLVATTAATGRFVKALVVGAVQRFTGALSAGAVQRFTSALAVGAVQRFTSAMKAMRAATVGFALHTAVAGLPATLAQMGRSFLGMLNPLALVRTAINLLKLAIAGTGIGLILLAIGAAGSFIVQNWEGVKAAFGAFKDAFMDALGPVKPILEPVFGVLSDLWDWFVKITGPLDTSTWVAFGETIGSAVGGAIKWVIETFQVFQKFFKDAINGLISLIPGWLRERMGIEVEAEPLTQEEMEERARERAENARDDADNVGRRASQEEREAARQRGQEAYDAEYAAAMAEIQAENARILADRQATEMAAALDDPGLIYRDEPAPSTTEALPAVSPPAPSDTTGSAAPAMMPNTAASGLDPATMADLDAGLAEASAGLDMRGKVTLDLTDMDLLMQTIGAARAALSSLGVATRDAAERAASGLERSRATNLQDRPTW